MQFVVFVNGRTRDEIVPILRERIERDTAAEMETGLQAMISIARARLTSQITSSS